MLTPKTNTSTNRRNNNTLRANSARTSSAFRANANANANANISDPRANTGMYSLSGNNNASDPRANNMNVNSLRNSLMKTLSAQKTNMAENVLNLNEPINTNKTPTTNKMNMKLQNHSYAVPMFELKHWYQHEMEAVGHLASMKDEYLRRMYASKTVSGMFHLVKAIQEKIDSTQYTNEKKHELLLMKDNVVQAMTHLKADYQVAEDNINYKWNVSGGGKKRKMKRKTRRQNRK